MRHWMLLPSLACFASCSYCFGPGGHGGKANGGFSDSQLDSLAEWASGENEPLQITFHGGEPLMAGKSFFKRALSRLRDARPTGEMSFGLQSNLWLLDEEWVEIFQAYRVQIGTSLDGPEEINDAQRGQGYFRRTMAGLELLRQKGVKAGCVATFTRQSARRWREVLDFFQQEGLGVTLHAALAPHDQKTVTSWSLSPSDYGNLLIEILDAQLGANMKLNLPVEPIESIFRGMGAGRCGLCTFDDCLGKYSAVSPDGNIFSCQRFVGKEAFRLGRLGSHGPESPLEESPAWQRLEARRANLADECGGCEFYDLCQGGCPYQALGADGLFSKGSLRDPYCVTYRQIFNTVLERGIEEFFDEANLTAVIDSPHPGGGLLQKGALLHRINAARRS